MTDKKASSEKVTVNLNMVDLGYIDLLVSQGFYSNRTDFIKTAVRDTLQKQRDQLDDLIQDKKRSTETVVGMVFISRKELMEKALENKQRQLTVIGYLFIPEDVELALIEQVYTSITVHGVIKAPQSIQAHYASK